MESNLIEVDIVNVMSTIKKTQVKRKIDPVKQAAANVSRSFKLKQFHAQNPLISKIDKKQGEELISFAALKDRAWTTFAGLNPESIQGLIDGTKQGYLKSWSYFCDQMMESDPHLKGLIDNRIEMLVGKKLIVQPKDSSQEAHLAAEVVKKVIDQIPGFKQNLRQLLMGIFTGVAVQEIVFQNHLEDGLCYVKKLYPISMARLKVDLVPLDKWGDPTDFDERNGYGEYRFLYWNDGDSGNPQGLDLLGQFNGKFIVHSPGPEILPHRRGLLRSIAQFYYIKRAVLAYWISGAEQYAWPLLWAKINKPANSDVQAHLASILRSISSANPVVVGESVDLNQIQNGATGGDAIAKSITTYVDSVMTKLILGGTLTVEASANGTEALGRVHQDNLLARQRADAESLCETLTHHLVIPILERNGHLFNSMPPIPKVYIELPTDYYGAAITQMHIDAGVITKNELRESIGLSPFTPEDGGNEIARFTPSDIAPEPNQSNLSDTPAMTGTFMSIVDVENLNGVSTYYPGKNKQTMYIKNSMNENDVLCVLKQEGNQWVIYSEDGNKELGRFKSKDEAINRLKEIEHFKNEEMNK